MVGSLDGDVEVEGGWLSCNVGLNDMVGCSLGVYEGLLLILGLRLGSCDGALLSDGTRVGCRLGLVEVDGLYDGIPVGSLLTLGIPEGVLAILVARGSPGIGTQVKLPASNNT